MQFVAKRFSGKRRINFVYYMFFLVMIAAVVILVQTMGNATPISSIDVWKIDEQSGINAEILWQKSVPCLNRGLGNLNGTTSILNNLVALPCKRFLLGDVVITYDLFSGEKQWDISSQSTDQIASLDNAYIIAFNDSFVRRVESDGDEIWRYKFPSRTARTIIPCEDFLCIPRGRGGIRHIRSPQTGKNLEDIEIEDVMAVYSDVLIRNVDTTVKVLDRETQATIWSVQVPYKLSYWRFIRYEDILLINYGEDVRAFDISTGTPLWEMQERSRSRLLLIDDKLVIYRPDNALQFYDVRNGNLLGNLMLQDKDNQNSRSLDVALSGNSDFLSIAYHDKKQVIVLKLDFAL